jgi:transmembrane sensor
MTEKEYVALCEKYLQGDCTPAEEILLEQYQDSYDMGNLPWVTNEMGDEYMMKRMLAKKLQQSMRQQPAARFKHQRWIAAAAAILLFITVGGYFLITKPTGNNQANIKKSTAFKNDVLPGSNKAILTLGNGMRVVLDNAKKGVISKQGNTAISKKEDGLIVYNANNPSQKDAKNPLNTITIPRGGRYQVVLPDGTQVWLNSASSLTFPTYFSGTERVVKLTGEAYFEVAKNKEMPFKVKLNNNSEISVLGTHFNVMAYDDEQEIKTTLLEGAVKLSAVNGSALLAPGQQGVLSRLGNAPYKVSNVNTAEAVAWKNGKFMFVNADMQSIMKKISRWYDVDVAYANGIPNQTFSGTVSQFNNVSQVLKLLQLTGAVHFEIEERRIYVMQ